MASDLRFGYFFRPGCRGKRSYTNNLDWISCTITNQHISPLEASKIMVILYQDYKSLNQRRQMLVADRTKNMPAAALVPWHSTRESGNQHSA